MPGFKLAPSILSADFGRLNSEIEQVEDLVELIHVDVMDGVFVPNITFGQAVVKKIKSKKPLDVHLMIVNPERHVEDFAKAGAGIIVVHAEACLHLHRVIQQVKSLGVKAGVALNPATPVNAVEPVLDEVDMALVMSVNPGFGGQKFIESSLEKVRKIRALKPGLDIQVDGGITPETIGKVAEAGANVFVAGSAIFGREDRAKAVEELRARLPKS